MPSPTPNPSHRNEKTGLFVFTRDLRVSDNRALQTLASQVDRIACIYVLEPTQERYQSRSRSDLVTAYLLHSLKALDRCLRSHGHRLLVVEGELATSTFELAQELSASHVGVSAASGFDEQKQVDNLEQLCHLHNIVFTSVWQHTLFERHQLPMQIDDLEGSFSRFRSKIENAKLCVRSPVLDIKLPTKSAELPHHSAITERCVDLDRLTKATGDLEAEAWLWLDRAGCLAGQQHLERYFASQHPQSYKQTRNALDEWSSSTKLSPWLAWGAVSVAEVYQALFRHERRFGANDSTYWIKFELLWREYFQWQAVRVGHELFASVGVANRQFVDRCSDTAALNEWRNGNTPYPLVNGIMKQLSKTGYISNRARQIAASCWTHEYKGEWRLGAACFQERLIDYDVAVNWGNWQYVAGVGFDPKGGRHFNLGKQTQMFDPLGEYIRRWHGEPTKISPQDPAATGTSGAQLDLGF